MAAAELGFGVLWLADFPVWAWRRLEPALAERELLVVAAGQVVSLTPALRQAGIRVGFSRERALALAPRAEVRLVDGIPQGLIEEEVLQACNRYTPWLESQRAGLLVARLTAHELAELAASFGARAGLASDRSSAYLAALAARPGQLLQVATGHEQLFRQALPLALLGRSELSPDCLQKLAWLGFNTVASLLGLTRAQLQARLAEGELLYWLSRWEDRRPVPLYSPPLELESRWSKEEELDDFEPVLRHLLGELLPRLGARRVSRVTVEADSVQFRRYLQSPTARPGPLWNAVLRAGQDALAACRERPDELSLRLGGLLSPPARQELLFAPARRSLRPEGLQKALRRLEARLPGRLFKVRYHNPDAYLPEEAWTLERLHPS